MQTSSQLGLTYKWWPFLPLIIVLSLALLLLTACQKSPSYEMVSAATLTAEDVIPAPTEEVILTLSGDLATKNEGDTLIFDMPTLEQLGLVKFTINDPWQETQVEYTGVLMSDLLEVAGASESATEVTITALDGYAPTVPIEEFRTHRVILATRSNGEYMTAEELGPTRIIFQYDDHPNSDEAKIYSVWQVASMEIK